MTHRWLDRCINHLEKLPFKLPYTGSVAFWIIIASVGVGATIAGVSYIVRKKHYIK